MPTEQQWVNLERNQKFVEDEVTSIERAGQCHFEVTFTNARPANFKVRAVPVSTAATYTATEEARNPNFKIRTTSGHTNQARNKVKLETDVWLPAAGGNQYQLEAKYKKKVIKSSTTVETWRKLYYQAIAMSGLSVPGLGPTEQAYHNLFIVLKHKGGTGTIPFRTNIRVDDWATGRLPLIQAAKGAYGLDQYKPWAFAAVFVNMIASRQEKEFLPSTSPNYSVGSGLFNWSAETLLFALPGGTYLWYGLEPTDDAANGGKGAWLVPGSCKFVEKDGTAHSIPDTNVSIDTSVARSPLGGYNQLKIALPWSFRDFFTSRQGRIAIKLRVVKGFAGGYSEPQINIITVAKRAWWDENDDAERLQILNHEMGHKIGMVPEGLGRCLDAGAHLYGGTLNPSADQKSHQGPHCENGATYTPGGSPQPWVGQPTCVMFGATSCYDPTLGQHRPTPSVFCPECESQVKKLDLNGNDLSGLRNSIMSF